MTNCIAGRQEHISPVPAPEQCVVFAHWMLCTGVGWMFTLHQGTSWSLFTWWGPAGRRGCSAPRPRGSPPGEGRSRQGICNTALHCAALHFTALHCTALHCTALHWTAEHSTEVHCTALNFAALHYTSLHCSRLYQTLLHCTGIWGVDHSQIFTAYSSFGWKKF